jgi:hypothetical protein
VFFEEAGEASLTARLAAAEAPVALLWGATLIGFLAAVILVTHVSQASAVAILAVEACLIIAAVALSAVWIRGQRTVVVEPDALALEGFVHHLRVFFPDIARVEIAPLSAGEVPCSRVSVHRRSGGRIRLDLPCDEALVLCRALQRRLFGGAATAPYDAALGTLDREKDPVSVWAARLRERFGQSGYRHAAGIAADQLDSALHDAALPASRRLGAALAMCALGGAEGAQGLRRVAPQLESASLRIAVERVADGTLDDEALAAAEAEDAALGR